MGGGALRRDLTLAGLSGLAGFALGALVLSAFSPPSVLEPLPRRLAPAVSPRAAEEPGSARPERAPVPAAPPSPAPNAKDHSAAEIALEARVAELERRLAMEHHLRLGAEGEHRAVPAGLPGRFRDETQLLETFDAALQKAGFADAQVESIDCTEHPCIVYGRGFGERGDLERLKPWLGPYREDGFSTFGFANGEGPTVRRFFGVAVMPSPEEGDDGLHRRLNFRVEQMYDASHAPPARR